MFSEIQESQIRERAYALFLERGGQGGSPLDDWIRAEKELAKGLASRLETSTEKESGRGAPPPRAGADRHNTSAVGQKPSSESQLNPPVRKKY